MVINEYKKGTMLRQGNTTGFVCDTHGDNQQCPIVVIWDKIKNPICYDEKWLNNKSNNIEIIDRKTYDKLLNSI